MGVKRLRRRSDGMVFGWNPDMAKNPDLEEFEEGDKTKVDEKKAAEYGGSGEGPNVEGVVQELGYPATGKPSHPLEPFGRVQPTAEEARIAGVDPALGKEEPPHLLHDEGLEHLFTGEPTAEEAAAARDAAMNPAGKTS